MKPGDRLLRRKEVEAMTGLCGSAIYQRLAKGEFPVPIKLGYKCVRWPASEVEAFVASFPRATGSEAA